MITKQILQNNVVLITETVPHAKAFSAGFYFLSAGSRYEDDSVRGISHFCEHMLFKGVCVPAGTKNACGGQNMPRGTENACGSQKLSAHDIALVFDRMGGYVNAFTERDDVCAYCTFPALENNLFKAIQTFCAMSSACTFPEEELERERSVIQNEITAVADDAEESAMDRLAEIMWPSQPLGKSITGTVSDVENLTREKLLSWYNEKFVHGELVVVVCGPLTEKDLQLLSEKLSVLPAHSHPLSYPYEMHVKEKAVWNPCVSFVNDKRFSQCQIYALYPFKMPLSHDDFSVLSVMNAIAGDTMSSRLFENLREKNGCCYSTYSFSTCYEDVAFWGATASCDKQHAVKIARLLQSELRGLVENPPSDEEIQIAKEHILGEEYLAGEDMEILMKRNLRHYAMGLELYDTEKVRDSIRNVQKNAIIDFVKNLLTDENRIFFVYGPKISGRQKKEMLCRL